jgi:hypothetical protein
MNSINGSRAEWHFGSMKNAQLRKGAFKKLVDLEGMRERLHGVPAPCRVSRARRSN